jgi:feruloyl esterase
MQVSILVHRNLPILVAFCVLVPAACVGQDTGNRSGQTAESCSKLSSLALPNTTITTAAEYPAGVNPTATSQSLTPASYAFKGVIDAPICRVAGTIKPTPVSNIRFEVWLPVKGWNGKYNGVGNGGAAGFIPYNAMQHPLSRGYATGSTDTGHVGSQLDGSWMLNNPELVADFAERAEHLTLVAAKAIVKAYYGKPPEYSYFSGCSTGGGQGMREAQRFPEDYNGIVNGDGARDLTHEWPGELYPAWVTEADQQGLVSKLPALHAAVLAKCDKIDGVQDGLIEDPTKCDFNPATIQCTAGVDNASCLTATQVDEVKKIYRGIKDPATGKIFWPGPAMGSELGWGGKIHPAGVLLPHSYMRSFVYLDPNWEYKDPAFNFDSLVALKDLNAASAKYGPMLDGDNPDLLPFVKHGGKILMYHGWNDPDIAPTTIISYYDRMVAAVGGSNSPVALAKTQQSARLFMVPGMGHCGGGVGPNSFDALTALEDWVEHGQAPEKIIASHMTNGVADRTRPLCPYPQTAVYNGSGSIDNAADFSCHGSGQGK